jgi:hypothetical protein
MAGNREQPSLWAELKAMTREAIKDVRETVVSQGWFGQREGPGEMGTPLNPTPQLVTQDLEGPQQSYHDMLRDASQRGQQEQDRGMER